MRRFILETNCRGHYPESVAFERAEHPAIVRKLHTPSPPL